MKVCPVCKARSFDDAQVCYGCLHKFTQQEMSAYQPPRPVAQAASGGSDSFAAGNAVSQLSGCAPAAQPQEQEVPRACGEVRVERSVSVPVRDADIVVRIELVERPRQQDASEGAGGEMPPECNVLRRGRPSRAVDIARPAEAGRGASAGQVGMRAQQEGRARHAAVSPVQSRVEAEIA